MSRNESTEPRIDYAVLKRGGIMRQRDPDRFAVRLHAVAGNFDAHQLTAVAEIAERYGHGEVHLTARQSIEIPHVAFSDLAAAKEALARAGLGLGACGPRLRIVTGCQGAKVCPQGLVKVDELAEALDANFYGRELPHKFKLAVSGCSNNCMKVQENDVGIVGAEETVWDEQDCSMCGVCEPACRAGAIKVTDETVLRSCQHCDQCGDCVAACPTGAWFAGRKGYAMYVGGKMGRRPVLGRRVPRFFTSQDEIIEAIERTLGFYQAHGRPSERFADTLARVGFRDYLKEVFDEHTHDRTEHPGHGLPDDLGQDQPGTATTRSG